MRTPAPCLLPTQPASRSMLLASGLSRQMIATQVAPGRLVALRRGVFVAASAWPASDVGRHLLRAKAEQVVHPSAVLSHASAALVWSLPHPGFTGWHDARPAVTLPADGGAKSRQGPVVHHIGPLPAGHVTRDADGYAVTTVARTAIDLSHGLALPSALVLLDGAARIIIQQIVEKPRKQDYANHRLAQAARALLLDAASAQRSSTLARHIALADPRRESAAESLSFGYFHLAGLPTPELQYPIRTRTGTYFPDFYWPDHHLIGECDGALKYTDAGTLVKEKVREDSLRELGNRFVRWLGGEIMARPQSVVGKVSRGLGL
ncbi:MAG: hypothetical protein ACOH16_02550 [Propionibacteriaceae bacterium]